MEGKVEVTNLIGHFIELIKKTQNEVKDLLGFGLQDYLSDQTGKYYLTQTFFYRNELIRFYSCFYPISCSYRELITKFEYINEIFEEYRYIVLIGGAGSGKSTIAKHIFLQAVKQAYKIPVLIELRHLNFSSKTIYDLIEEKVLSTRANSSVDIFQRAMKRGAFLFLFDGYDEIYSHKLQRIVGDIEGFVDTYPKNDFLITSRPGSGVENTQRFYPFVVQSLNEDELKGFVELLIPDDERKDQILKLIQGSESHDFIEYLKNPLLLSMFILAFESHPEIPRRKTAFYKNVFDTLYSRHDGVTKSSFPRERRTNLQREDFENVFSAFSYLSYAEGKYSFTEEYLEEKLIRVKSKVLNIDFNIENLIYDFRTSIGMLLKDGFEYKFPHRSMQEYFAALFISRLSSDRKKIAYNKVIKRPEHSFDNSINFIEICEELDEIPVLENIIIPILEDYVNYFEPIDDESLFLKFTEYWEMSLELNRPDLESKNYFIPYAKNPFFLLGKLELSSPHLIEFMDDLKIKDLKLSISKRTRLDHPYTKEIVTILNDKGIVKPIHKHLKSIETWIEACRKKIIESEEKLDDFL